MTEYTSVGIKNIEQARFDIDALDAEARAAEGRLGRVDELLKGGWATRAQRDEAIRWVASARARLDAKRVEMKEQMRLAGNSAGRLFYNGRELVGRMGDLEADIRMARYEVGISHQSHEALLKHRERLAVRAPFAGRLVDLPHAENSSVKRGDVIAVFERNDERRVLAYLTQDEVLKIGLGDKATVYFPSLNESTRGRVEAIDRTAGFRDEMARKHSWRAPEDRSAHVILALDGADAEAVRTRYEAGLPVVVLFEARSTNPVLAAMWRKIAALLL